jgi:hypothetical protein
MESAPSMILLQAYTVSVTLYPFEGDAPWTVDVQTVACRFSLQSMKLHAGQIQIRQRASLIKGIQSSESSRMHIWTHFNARACLKKHLESNVHEALDHGAIVKQQLTPVKD